ncbi:proline iminopeptidase-family hydrolase [Novosphingobium sp. KA1]|uniref:proline iminopeptidase-family hydrolase n=1 Tax=Novosphingobium sp. (strain KA1) TaxID=164608 RepID=UPI001F5D2500|nr:proline iminopeptidase-family hydrolase [Novosphingobium sp. KA1]
MPMNRREVLGQGLWAGLAAGLAATASPLLARAPDSYPAPDRELMVPVEGGRIYVRVNGRLDGPLAPLVAIHGGPGGNHAAFLDLLALAGERAVILYDQLDCGLSDRPGSPANWRVGRFVDEVEAVRRALGIARWHVLGQSWGGTVALEHGARRPQGLASLILASPLVSTRSWIADAAVLRRQLAPGVQKTLDACDPPAPITPACEQATEVFYANFLSREPRSEGYRAYLAAHPALRMNAELYNAMWGSSEFVSTGTLRTYDGEPLLARLDGPRTLFATGQYDEARPATLGSFAQRVKGAEFAVVPGGGHAFISDRPDEALGIIRPWLARNES